VTLLVSLYDYLPYDGGEVATSLETVTLISQENHLLLLELRLLLEESCTLRLFCNANFCNNGLVIGDKAC
jgi:hypothetical protein